MDNNHIDVSKIKSKDIFIILTLNRLIRTNFTYKYFLYLNLEYIYIIQANFRYINLIYCFFLNIFSLKFVYDFELLRDRVI